MPAVRDSTVGTLERLVRLWLQSLQAKSASAPRPSAATTGNATVIATPAARPPPTAPPIDASPVVTQRRSTQEYPQPPPLQRRPCLHRSSQSRCRRQMN